MTPLRRTRSLAATNSAAKGAPKRTSVADAQIDLASGQWTFVFHDGDKVLGEKVYEDPELGGEMPARRHRTRSGPERSV
jgi:hypothetical protein